MKSIEIEIPVGATFFGKELHEHQEAVAKETGLPVEAIRVRYVTLETGEKWKAMIFYEVTEEEEVEEW